MTDQQPQLPTPVYRLTLMRMLYGNDIAATSAWRTEYVTIPPHGGMRLSGDDWNATIEHIEHSEDEENVVTLYGVCEPGQFMTKQDLDDLRECGWDVTR